MSLTIQAARIEAAEKTRATLGLSETPPHAWTYEERTAYNKALAAYIQSRPDEFTDQDLLTADLVSKQMYSALDDSSFQVGTFIAETVAPITDAAQAVGAGVLSTANAARWLIPVGAAIAALVGINELTGGGVAKFIRSLSK